MASNSTNWKYCLRIAAVGVFAGFAYPSEAAGPSAQCDYYDHGTHRSNFGKCTVEEDGSGNVYRWVVRFEDGSSVTVTEDVGARAAARSWKINGSPAVGIEINRMHFRGVTTDLKKSIDWSFESDGSEAVSLDQGNPDSSKIEYDPKKALHARIFNDFVMETTGCLRAAVKTALAIGRRNRNEILSWATQTCGGKVPYIYETIGRPQQEGRAYITALAETQLNDVLKYGQ